MFKKKIALLASLSAALAPVFSFAADGGGGSSTSTSVDVPALVKASFDALQGDVVTISGYAFSLLTLTVGVFIGMKLFKRFASKAS